MVIIISGKPKKVALVTGAGRGIGKAIAIELSQNNASVVIINDVNEADAKACVDEIEKLGTKAEYIIADVSKFNEAEKMVDSVVQKHGSLDILVNNAGITRDTLILRMKEDDWDKVLAVNLKSAFNTIKAVSKHMLKNKSGKIINISSVIGLIGNAGQCNYAASKAGLIGLTKSIARELAPRGITVNAVAPGFIQTDMTAKLPEEAKTKLKAQIPMGILGTTENVANLVGFLACDKSSYITGQVICVDGGMVMS